MLCPHKGQRTSKARLQAVVCHQLHILLIATRIHIIGEVREAEAHLLLACGEEALSRPGSGGCLNSPGLFLCFLTLEDGGNIIYHSSFISLKVRSLRGPLPNSRL